MIRSASGPASTTDRLGRGTLSRARPRNAAAFVDDMMAAFERARAADGAVTTAYRLGGRTAGLKIAGRGLAGGITRAFCHLRDPRLDPASADLKIHLWDGVETAVGCPVRYLRDVFHRSWPFGRMVLAASADERLIGLQSHHAITVLDLDSGRVVGFVESLERLSMFELGKPLQPLLFAYHSEHDVVPVHAGLVAREGEGILFAGAGGSGKSTTTLLCLEAGFEYLGDDYIGLPPAQDGEYRGHSFYNSTWLEPDHLQRFSWLGGHARRGGPEEDKLLVLLADVEPELLASEARLAALALPRVTGRRDTTFHSVSGGEAVLRLAPSSILQLPFIGAAKALERMAEMARALPAYRLELGTDLEQIPGRVAEMLAQAISA